MEEKEKNQLIEVSDKIFKGGGGNYLRLAAN